MKQERHFVEWLVFCGGRNKSKFFTHNLRGTVVG
jgi:hypothetical protein